ncbi:unnamed protein product [Dicrocoelium dendriticum]|nr:unnamed protein product [Dicrocoelium dendriticum]
MADDTIDNRLRPPPALRPPVDTSFIKVSAEEVCDPNLYYPIRSSNPAKRIFRGYCLLINQRDFSPSTGQGRRDGTDVDADRVERLFKVLGYNVQRHFNVNRTDFIRILNEMSSLDHSQFDSFVCFILSHGENGVIYATDGAVPLDVIMAFFRGDVSVSLVGKPKLFFIQACRGSEFDRGAAIPMVTDAAGEIIVTKLPVEADILVAQSTVPGYFAWRNSAVGSWFIQELCRTLEQDTQRKPIRDVLSLLTVVARCVAYQYRSNTGQMGSHNMVQMTCFTSTLTRLVYLTGNPGV